MALPAPEPGLVIRYDFPWEDEDAAGRDHGKTRPACLVATVNDPELPLFGHIADHPFAAHWRIGGR
jgi:hypothetical protein